MKLFNHKPRSAGITDSAEIRPGGRIFSDGHDTAIGLSFKREQYIAYSYICARTIAALTIDNCLGVTVEGCHIHADGSRHGILIADNSYNIWLDGITFGGRSKFAEIVIGYRPFLVPDSAWHGCGVVTLRDIKSDTGKPVRVSVWDSPRPIVIGDSNVQITMRSSRTIKAAKWLHKKGLL